ncbi:MAG: NfeD family protein [Planctomycetota bacterium]
MNFFQRMLSIVATLAFATTLYRSHVLAQDANEAAASELGLLVNVDTAWKASDVAEIGRVLDEAGNAAGGRRATVVFHYREPGEASSASQALESSSFEASLAMTRLLADPENADVRKVALLDRNVKETELMPLLAMDLWLATKAPRLVGYSESGDAIETATIDAVARRSGIFPAELVTAWVDPSLPVAIVETSEGDTAIAVGDDLVQRRAAGEFRAETSLRPDGGPVELTTDQMRRLGLLAASVENLEAATSWLDLAGVREVETSRSSNGPGVTRAIAIRGAISGGRVRRWLDAIGRGVDEDTGQLVLQINSNGGEPNASLRLALDLADGSITDVSTAALIEGEARGDASLIALATEELFMLTDSTLGGAGGGQAVVDNIEREQIAEVVDAIAKNTGRAAGLIEAVVIPGLKVQIWTNRQTGEKSYVAVDRLNEVLENPEEWERGEEVSFPEPIDAKTAAKYGLIDGVVNDANEFQSRLGLSEPPQMIQDSRWIRMVERIGGSPGLSATILMVAIVMLYLELNLPGLSVPGFISLCAFGFFFWIKFLAGTAEWLELVLLVVGLVGIGIEIFLVPGLGIFGIGGGILTIAGLVLMTQSFVLPRNTYQVELLAETIWSGLAALVVLVVAALVMWRISPHDRLFNSLQMTTGAGVPGGEDVDGDAGTTSAEAIRGVVVGQLGTANTPLRPAGKAKFGHDIVQVISDGSVVEIGEEIRVVEVRANRIVVEPLT